MTKDKPWIGYVKPGRIFGNLYFVGTRPASTHIIDTGEGLIMIDPGYHDSLYLVIQNMWELGLNPKDIKYILLSHGHHDHFDGAPALKELTGAITFLGKDDLDRAKGLSSSFVRYPFTPDVLINDGDIISLGNTKIRCVSTPGHTDGVISFFFNVTDGKTTYTAGMHGGVGYNTLNKEYLTRTGEPFENRQKYFDSLDKIENEKVDIFIGNHVKNNDTIGKLALAETSQENPFIDPTAWKKFIQKCRQGLIDLIEREKEE